MSKLDAQRAMREARYAARNSSGPTRREAAGAPAAPTPAQPEAKPRKSTRATPAQEEPAAAVDSAALCGHTSMNGRACTRPAGHAEKSHRYS